MGKKYNTQYRIHVYDMCNPYNQSQRAFLPALKIKGQQAPVCYANQMVVFATEELAIEWARKEWWQELGLPDPSVMDNLASS